MARKGILKNMKSISLKIFISVCILIVLHVAPDGPQSSRFTDTVRALVDFGTFALPKDVPHHVDVVQIKGQLYSVIAPGLPIILAPLYWVYRNLTSIIGLPMNDVFWGGFNCLANATVTAPLLGVTAIAMLDTLRYLTNDTSKQIWLVFISIFGSFVFFYSTYGIWVHVYTMALVFIAFNLILRKRNNFLIGLVLGIAQIIDYIAILPISFLIGFWIYTNRKANLKNLIRTGLLVLLGYSIFLIGLLYYNYTITDSPFQTPNSLFLQQANQQQLSSRSMFMLPSIASLWGLSFSPYRGLYLYFPMTFLFTWSLFKKSYLKNSVILFSMIIVIFTFLYNSTYYAWSGDVCFGPRHLLVAVPFIILPTVYCSLKYIKIFGCLSIFISLAGVSTIPSNNLFTNIFMFIYRGPFLHWLDFAYKTVLPKYFNINLYLVTPFFLYVGIGLIFYIIWKPELTKMD